MLTDYLVHCPNPRCGWSGCLISRPEPFTSRGLRAGVSIVAFQCPVCQQVWRARIREEEIEAQLFDDIDTDLAPAMWPHLDPGVGN